ncbi:FHA domain-containing protein [Plectonema cf. radiosum LEGE 06105]|uniref:FHA domain-containing protein n=1 Tax=Plectonema cf. radiosum LEGE 06105 TaxID=945769 RepID=A0A8J7FE42_9CYAN|nr:FHA domain-containing protein [Plectonema radiosum]MBE9212576.1 FHA domain-containing protein [Plectonema cf. radiosum LEGE 06105]
MAINKQYRILIADSSTDCSNDKSMAVQSNETHILIIEDDQGRKEFTLESPLYSIGRDRDCDIHLVSQFVSRRHATLVKLPREDDNEKRYYYRIVDGDIKGKASSNGLMINGRSKVPAHDLKNEDEVVFGPQVRAIYYLLQRDATQTGQMDASEYDITLINPSMTEDAEDTED